MLSFYLAPSNSSRAKHARLQCSVDKSCMWPFREFLSERTTVYILKCAMQHGFIQCGSLFSSLHFPTKYNPSTTMAVDEFSAPLCWLSEHLVRVNTCYMLLTAENSLFTAYNSLFFRRAGNRWANSLVKRKKRNATEPTLISEQKSQQIETSTLHQLSNLIHSSATLADVSPFIYSIRPIMETLDVLASTHGSSTRHFFGCCEGRHRKESQRYIGEDRPTKRRSGRFGQWARPSGLDEGRLLQDPATCLLSQLSNATQINQVQRKNYSKTTATASEKIH